MKRILFCRICAVVLLCFVCIDALAQRTSIPAFLLDPTYRSTRSNEKKALMDGNQISINFFNTGLQAGTGEVRAEWPRGSESFYVGDVVPTIVAEVPIDANNDGVVDTMIFHAVTPRHPRAGSNQDPQNLSLVWGFEPMGGFANDDGVNEKPAVSNDRDSWPAFWPDQPDWINPATGKAEWNGFFGRGVQNADLESYFWIDDNNDREIQRAYPSFAPDSTDPSRGGLGLAVKVRGLQWSQFLAQDALFTLYEVVNTSTTTYPRVSVGLTIGTLAGGDGDSQDDLAFFDQLNRIVYSWDTPPFVGANGQNVGIVGYAFMESPGNALDGIDNDGDSDRNNVDGFPFVPDASLRGSGNLFSSSDFEPRTFAAGDPIVLIDPEFKRSYAYVPSDGSSITVVSQGKSYNVSAGTTLEEQRIRINSQLGTQLVVEKDLIDNDLDGLIDEDEFLHFERRAQEFDGNVKTLPPVRFVNYVEYGRSTRGRDPVRADSLSNGFLNPMIDETDQDGIDNDGDWRSGPDDVGADGVAATGDTGEGDGKPTIGEPNFERLDVNETDQVGLSNFFYFTPPGALRMNEDNRIWSAMTPGFFTTNEELVAQQSTGGVDGDFIFGSGYFRLEPGQSLRFSMAMVFGNGQDFGQKLSTVTRNVETVQEIFDRNYNFARPPDKPRITAVPGDKEVTLFWNALAEESIDPILGKDFQGYKLYKATDPNFADALPITDAFGREALRVPIAQFDLKDGVKDFWVTGDASLINRTAGIPFYLGEDSGLKHSFVDKDVENGRRYFYAVTAYDRGSPDFFPAENSTLVSVTETGDVQPDINVAVVTPNAAVAGFTRGDVDSRLVHTAGPATGEVFAEALDPSQFEENIDYEVTFEGSEFGSSTFSVSAGGSIKASQASIAGAEGVVFDGIRLLFRNDQSKVDPDNTNWADTTAGLRPISAFVPNVALWRFTGSALPYDYEVRFTAEVSATSIEKKLGTASLAPTAPATDTYFNVQNLSTGGPATFAFLEGSASTRNGRLDASGESITIYESIDNELKAVFSITFASGGTGTLPVAGDVFKLNTLKPFRPIDKFTFRARRSDVDDVSARDQLELVKVVPNPYVAAAKWELRNPTTITTGRGQRRIDFIHLPVNAKIQIYSVRGELVQELFHDGSITDGTVSWDLRTRAGLDVAFGVYFYRVWVDGVGETTGKLAIIK